MAKTHDKALVIHDRDAHADVLRVLDEEGAPCTHGVPLLQRRRRDGRHCTERGWFLSFAGTVTFKNAPDCARHWP
jgi:TatD DNase family protein